MGDSPSTRPSLLLRIREPGDHEAWSRFVALYGPLVYRYARNRGLQDSDAADLTQIVFHEVARQIQRLDYDAQRGKFRGWLFGVTRNQLRKHLERARRTVRPGGEEIEYQELECETASDQEEARWQEEYEWQLFHMACERVRVEFGDRSWQAFWRTAVEGQTAQEVGRELGVSIGAVYTAKSRVLARLRDAVSELDEEDR